MGIAINDKNAYQNYLNSNRVILKLSSRKNLRRITYMLAVGVVVTLWGFLFVPSITTISKMNHVTNQMETTTEKTSFNLIGSLGVAYIIMTLVTVFANKRQEDKNFVEAAEDVKGFYKNKNESTVIINDENVTIENPMYVSIIKWATFIDYFEFENFLLLNLNRNHTNAVFINKELVSSETYSSILDLVNSKVRKRLV